MTLPLSPTAQAALERLERERRNQAGLKSLQSLRRAQAYRRHLQRLRAAQAAAVDAGFPTLHEQRYATRTAHLLAVIRANPGATTRLVAEETGLTMNQAASRLLRLHQAGRLHQTVERRPDGVRIAHWTAPE